MAISGGGTRDTAQVLNNYLASDAGLLRSPVNKGDGSIVVAPVEKDHYGWMVAELFVKPRPRQGYQPREEIGLNSQMVLDGYAYHYAQYSDSRPNGQVLSQLEAAASSG